MSSRRLGRPRGSGRGKAFVDDDFGLAGRLFEVLGEHLGCDGFDDGADFGLLSLLLVWASNCGLGSLDADTM